jgi:hypothetical protein
MALFKSKILMLALGAIMIAGIILVVFLPKNSATNLPQSLNLNNQIGVGTDICLEFPKEWVAMAIGRSILKTKQFHTDGTNNCQYYIDETNFAVIKAENFSVENQKQGQISLGRTIKTDSRIKMENFIAWQGDGLINNIYLVLNPNKFVSIDRSSTKVYGNEEGEIAFAIKVADRIQKRENHVTGSASSSTVTEFPTPTVKVIVFQPQVVEADTVNNFFNLINEHKITDAISMFTVQALGDESQKQAWGVMFNAFESVKVKSVSSSMPEEWTASKHTYKVIMDVKMKPESANVQPMPYYGWGNREFYRWVTLEKVGNFWRIDGISTGP